MDKEQVKEINFSVKGLFFIDYNLKRLNLWYKGLSKKVHFTIAYNENSEYINLHLTKNLYSDKSKINNPKIEIVRFQKDIFNALENELSQFFINELFVPINVNDFHLNGYRFISLDEENSEKEGFELISMIKSFCKLKQNKRYKIEGDIESKLLELIGTIDSDSIVKNKKETISERKDRESGFFLKGDKEMIGVIKIEDNWFRLNEKISVEKLLSKILGKERTNYLFKHFKDSMKIIDSLKSKGESEKYNDRGLIISLNKEYMEKLNNLENK